MKRYPHADHCEFSGCPEFARGDVWPPKYVGTPLTPSMRACERHLEIAEHAGSTVMRDGQAGK